MYFMDYVVRKDGIMDDSAKATVDPHFSRPTFLIKISFIGLAS